MKITRAQKEVLMRLAAGESLVIMDGKNACSFWSKNLKVCNGNSIHALFKKGLIQSNGNFVRKQWILTDAGLEAVREDV